MGDKTAGRRSGYPWSKGASESQKRNSIATSHTSVSHRTSNMLTTQSGGDTSAKGTKGRERVEGSTSRARPRVAARYPRDSIRVSRVNKIVGSVNEPAVVYYTQPVIAGADNNSNDKWLQTLQDTQLQVEKIRKELHDSTLHFENKSRENKQLFDKNFADAFSEGVGNGVT